MSFQSCPPAVPPPCPASCQPPPPPPPCRVKPIMRRIHWTQSMSNVYAALALSGLSGAMLYFFNSSTRIETYRQFNLKAEKDDWADEMARKGMFQAVSKESMEDFKK